MELSTEKNSLQSTDYSRRKENVSSAARSNLDERQSAFGPAKNADTRLPETHTMSAVDAVVTVSDKDKTKAIFDSISTDNRFYPENPTKTKISMKKNTIYIEIDSNDLEVDGYGIRTERVDDDQVERSRGSFFH